VHENRRHCVSRNISQQIIQHFACTPNGCEDGGDLATNMDNMGRRRPSAPTRLDAHSGIRIGSDLPPPMSHIPYPISRPYTIPHTNPFGPVSVLSPLRTAVCHFLGLRLVKCCWNLPYCHSCIQRMTGDGLQVGS